MPTDCRYRTIVADPRWPYEGFASSPDNPFPGARDEGPSSAPIARRQRLGWDTWGHEALNHIEIPA